eukprot:SM000039S14514  [mRNA]  locus=s39:530202:531511:- [translate_table: standard]
MQAAAAGVTQGPNWPHCQHLLGFILNRDLNSARFLWKRIPAAVKSDEGSGGAELAAAWRVAQCMWRHDRPGVHAALRAFSWSPDVAPLAAAVADDYAARMFKLLSTAYSTISVANAAAFLGLSEAKTIEFTTARSWELDSTAGMLMVRSRMAVQKSRASLGRLQSLTEFVFHLEH